MRRYEQSLLGSDTETSESSQTKRKNEELERSDESQRKRIAEWKEAAEADREVAKTWKAPEITDE